MNYFEFNLLPEIEKLSETWANGVLIGERNSGAARYELYQLEDFYVELVRHPHRKIIQITRTFRATCYLDPYLQAVDISVITKNGRA
ncbi:MAG: hypothetical protein ABUT20_11640 [Bacteroidota bacterium]